MLQLNLTKAFKKEPALKDVYKMKTVKILHTADIHIGARDNFLKSDAQKRRLETLLTFERIVDLAKENQVDIITIAGDLFDSNSVEESFVSAVFSKIALSGIPTVFSAGNHDPLSADSPFLTRDLPRNLYVLGAEDECITFEELSLKVYGRSFSEVYLKGEPKFTLDIDEDYVNLMVQHGELKSDLSSDYNSITPSFVKESKMDYIALGHVHKKTPIGKIDRTSFAYPGCPEGQGFDELDEKGVYIGEIGRNVCNLRFVSVSKRQHIHHKTQVLGDISSSELCDKILAELKESFGDEYSENLYKIELCGEISPELEIDTKEISLRLEEMLFFVKVIDSTEIKLDLNELANEPSLKGIFVRKMLGRIDEASENEKEKYKKALKIGLKAFTREVKYDEN